MGKQARIRKARRVAHRLQAVTFAEDQCSVLLTPSQVENARKLGFEFQPWPAELEVTHVEARPVITLHKTLQKFDA